MLMKRSIFLLLVVLLVVGGSLSGCGGQATDDHTLPMAPLEQMPPDVQSAPITVQQAYQFAVANPDVLQHLPCYCGCGKMGHTSNYACYVARIDSSGAVAFDAHALGCSICVDITQDAMRLLKQGQSVTDIKQYVDTTYAKYGPSNMP